MPDTQSTVEILLKVQSEKAALAETQADLAKLRAETGLTNQSMVQFGSTTARLGTLSTDLQRRLLEAAAAGGPVSAAATQAGAAVKGAGEAMAATEINAARLSTNLGYVAGDMARLIPGTQGLGREIQYLGRDFGGLGAQIGVMGLAMTAVGVGAALAFAAALASVITKGIELQKTLQDVKEGVEGTLSTDSTKFGGGLAQQTGSAAVDLIVATAREAQVPISELAKAFDQINPSATRANASIEQQVKLVAELAAQSGALHIPQAKIITDLEQIYNGNVRNTNQLAQRLDITKAEAVQARASGDITDLLINKEREFAQAHQEGSDTIERAQQKVQAAFQQLALAATKPIVEPLTNALNALSAAMNSVDAKNVISQVESIIGIAQKAIGVYQTLGNAILNALQSAAKFAADVGKAQQNEEDQSKALELTEGPPSQYPTIAEDQTGEPYKQMKGLTIRPGLQPAVGAGGGGGGRKGPSQDTLDQQKISAIMSEVNEKQAQYNSLVEKNKVDHELGITSLQKEQSLNLSIGQSFLATIDKEEAKLEEMKSKVEAVGAAQGGLNDKETQQVNKLQEAIDKLEKLRNQMRLANAGNDFFGQWTLSMNKFIDTLTLTGTKAAQTFQGIINTGIDSTSQALTGLIFQTKNWQQAFVQAGESIVQSLIKVMLQALVGMALQKSTQEGTKLSDAAAAARKVYVSAGEIPYIGWIIAPIAAAAAFAACLAFQEGGIVPGGYSATDNMVAMVRSGEGILTPGAVAAIGGPSVIHSLNQSASFATGGVVGSGSFGSVSSRGVSVNNFWDKDDMVQHMISHPDLEHFVVNTMRRNRFQLKV